MVAVEEEVEEEEVMGEVLDDAEDDEQERRMRSVGLVERTVLQEVGGWVGGMGPYLHQRPAPNIKHKFKTHTDTCVVLNLSKSLSFCWVFI